MLIRSCALMILLVVAALPLEAGDYVLRFERLAARGWRGKPEEGQVLLRYEMTVRAEVPFHCGVVAGRDRLSLAGLVMPDAAGHVQLSLTPQISLAGEGGETATAAEGWSNQFELALNPGEPALISPTDGKHWKLTAGKQINARSVARERIRVQAFDSPHADDRGVQLASALEGDPSQDGDYRIRISEVSAAGSKGAAPEQEPLALFFDARPGVATVVRCAIGTTECVSRTLLLPSQAGRLRADATVSFMQHDKSFSPDRMNQPHDVVSQLSARTTVHARLGERISVGGAPVQRNARDPRAGNSGLCLRIDGPERK